MLSISNLPTINDIPLVHVTQGAIPFISISHNAGVDGFDIEWDVTSLNGGTSPLEFVSSNVAGQLSLACAPNVDGDQILTISVNAGTDLTYLSNTLYTVTLSNNDLPTPFEVEISFRVEVLGGVVVTKEPCSDSFSVGPAATWISQNPELTAADKSGELITNETTSKEQTYEITEPQTVTTEECSSVYGYNSWKRSITYRELTDACGCGAPATPDTPLLYVEEVDDNVSEFDSPFVKDNKPSFQIQAVNQNSNCDSCSIIAKESTVILSPIAIPVNVNPAFQWTQGVEHDPLNPVIAAGCDTATITYNAYIDGELVDTSVQDLTGDFNTPAEYEYVINTSLEKFTEGQYKVEAVLANCCCTFQAANLYFYVGDKIQVTETSCGNYTFKNCTNSIYYVVSKDYQLNLLDITATNDLTFNADINVVELTDNGVAYTPFGGNPIVTTDMIRLAPGESFTVSYINQGIYPFEWYREIEDSENFGEFIPDEQSRSYFNYVAFCDIESCIDSLLKNNICSIDNIRCDEREVLEKKLIEQTILNTWWLFEANVRKYLDYRSTFAEEFDTQVTFRIDELITVLQEYCAECEIDTSTTDCGCD